MAATGHVGRRIESQASPESRRRCLRGSEERNRDAETSQEEPRDPNDDRSDQRDHTHARDNRSESLLRHVGGLLTSLLRGVMRNGSLILSGGWSNRRLILRRRRDRRLVLWRRRRRLVLRRRGGQARCDRLAATRAERGAFRNLSTTLRAERHRVSPWEARPPVNGRKATKCTARPQGEWRETTMVYCDQRGSGGTGRRAGLRILWPKGREGSTPSFRTNLLLHSLAYQIGFRR